MSVITNAVLPILASLIKEKAEAIYNDQMEEHRALKDPDNNENAYGGAYVSKDEAIAVECGFVIEQIRDEHKLSDEDVELLRQALNVEG